MNKMPIPLLSRSLSPSREHFNSLRLMKYPLRRVPMPGGISGTLSVWSCLATYSIAHTPLKLGFFTYGPRCSLPYSIAPLLEEIMTAKGKALRPILFSIAMSFVLGLTTFVGAENSTTIDNSTQPHLKSWSNVIPNGARRFVVLPDFNNEAVLDRETGLVWERSPTTNTMNWYDAVRSCWQHQAGGRMGWHLPTVEELSSLVDPASPPPALPSGHPFQNIQPDYWSSTTDIRVPFLPTQAWDVRFGNPGQIGDSGKDSLLNRWCVRGGTHSDKYK